MSQTEAHSPNTPTLLNTLAKPTIASHRAFDETQFTQDHADKILSKYPRRYPILIWKLESDIAIKRRKFIAPQDITLGQFLYVLRKQLVDFNAAEGLFLFVESTNMLLPAGDEIGKLWHQHNVNGFLRLTLAKENTFG